MHHPLPAVVLGQDGESLEDQFFITLDDRDRRALRRLAWYLHRSEEEQLAALIHHSLQAVRP